MGGTLYVSLFEAAQAATEARQNQMAATAVMGQGQTKVLNEVTNSWTQHLSANQQFSITASCYKSGFKSWLTSSKLKQLVTAEVNWYYRGYHYSSVQGGVNGPTTYQHSGWSTAQQSVYKDIERGHIASFIKNARSHGLRMNYSDTFGSLEPNSETNFQVGSITTACAKSLFNQFLAVGAIPKSSVTHKASKATLSELAAHVAYEAGLNLSSKNPANTVAQTLLNQAQRSYQAAQANANAGVTAVQNQSGQDSYMMQQDGMLATTINTALQQAAGLSISA